MSRRQPRATLTAARATVGLAALLAGLAFWAPAPAAAQELQDKEAAPAEGEIVVTATRAGRDGRDAPTPTTAIGADFIEASIRPNVADVINLLPQASVSATPRSTIGNSINAGANLINLRALGTARTLVLLDGRRVAPSTIVGAGVDINVLPTVLLKRVDVVTGGASAIWGSDAMAGVVNFVLDRNFTGLKANVEGGVSGQGDGEYYQGELAWGTGFAGGRGHLLLSAQYSEVGRVGGPAGRDWYKGYKVIANQAFTAGSGLPTRIILPGVGLAQATGGGLITAGPLRGIQFGPGGVPLPFNFGYASGSVSVGGTAEDWGGNMEIQSPVWNANVYGRLSYELTPSVTAYAEYSFSKAKATFTQVPYWRLANITIQRDNAFLDPGIATQMANLPTPITNFQMGSYNADIGPAVGVNDRRFQRWVAGVYGDLGGGWQWDAYYQGGRTHLIIDVRNNPIVNNYNLAIDAVRGPGGAIVCRSTLASPTNGCVPLNIFGVGSGAQAAINYVTGTEHHDQYLDQDVVAASVRGEPLKLPGGPLSVAAGVEYRRESFRMTADPISAAGGFFLNNFKAAQGDFDVKEAFAEVVAPVLGDLPLVKALSLNGAVRFTDYSSSGSIATWKVGGVWDVAGGLRFRGTLSRDIRAPNLYEIYQPPATFTQSINDPVTNTSYNATIVTPGNNQLRPEVADTKSFGAVYQPDWAPGLLLSADYFDISIKDAIGSPSVATTITLCAAGEQSVCQLVTRGGNGLISQVIWRTQNLSAEATRGIDFELGYRHALAGGEGSFRLLGTWVDKRTIRTGATTIDYAGTIADATAVPDWRFLATLGYERGPVRANLNVRFIGGGWTSYTKTDIINGTAPGIAYLDLSAALKVTKEAEIYAGVTNLLDRDPPVSPSVLVGIPYAATGANAWVYDLVGRQFQLGARLRF